MGQMKFGTTNNAGTDQTYLVSTAFTTLTVEGHQGTGIVGKSDPGNGVTGDSKSGCGVFGQTSTGLGTRGLALDAGTGVHGESRGLNGNGVVGVAFNGTNAYGIWGQGGDGWAGWFSGKVRVTDTLSKGAGGFLIDHPLDPENRYLLHSFVESDERLNVYSGMVVTDADGAAVIELPEYFEALNEDFRYQLTVIGVFAQAIVTEEVRENRFTIATDRPEVKVSWQVSGVRRDPFARANPLGVDEEKPEEERGTYVHPEAWGKPAEAGAEFARVAALRERQPGALKPDDYRMPAVVGGEKQA
ncbi:hypothetical protein J7F01_32855 [Streptomyces sp. ISL-22]|uniref:hypothetical protein n=1 Tax=unclassified Streptomyces TaxID=2593676 RepID=UPI001BE9E6AC|nr:MULTISPECIES: hypothetical protein [unclassified Streptomyces]MBT2419365.1 hypothetical protein [Streptomyces sp. ISL-24]MBT2436861.1 hypothetical protein [Streptomyces sp. ISL-22]